ncbi:MAG: flagellar export chaperone FlgN [Synergistaceae bacterium]|nr:flagellar export chaperone FlgN [Synergistaceae bacterium]
MQRPEHSPSQDKVLQQAKDLIRREIKYCRHLRAMISRELEAIVLNGDMDELSGILEQKDEVISQLQLLADGWRDILTESGLDSNAQNTDGFGMRLLEIFPDDEELPALIEESREIAGSIIKAEDDAISEIEKYSAGLRSQMVSRANAKNAAASYAKMGGGYFY